MHTLQAVIYFCTDGCWREETNFPLWLHWLLVIPRNTNMAAEAADRLNGSYFPPGVLEINIKPSSSTSSSLLKLN